MFAKAVVLTLALASFAAVNGQLEVIGPCPEVTVVSNFTLENYAGWWYRHSVYTKPHAEGRCDDIQYRPSMVPGEADALDHAYYAESGLTQYAYGAIISREPGTGNFSFGTDDEEFIWNNDYLILGTDYTTFSVVFGCTADGLRSYHYAWILTRERRPSGGVLAKAHQVIVQNGLVDTFVEINQVDCVTQRVK